MTRTRRRAGVLRVVGVLVGLGLVLAACGGDSDGGGGGDDATGNATAGPDVTVEASGAPQTGGSVTYGLEAETDGFNPAVNRWAISGFMVANAVFDPLAAYDADGNPQPYLAEAFTPNADFTSWTIELRDGITFTNGEPLDGAAVKKSLDAIRASALTGAALANIADIQVDPADPQNVIVTMAQPWASFPATLVSQVGYVPAPAQLDAPAEESSRNPIGTGPFAQSEWVPDNQWVGTKNADYWRTDADGTQLPYLDSVTFKPIPDNGNRINALTTGDIQMTQASNWGTIRQLREDAANGQIQIVEDPGEGEESFVMLNTSAPPFDDIRVRQAVADCTDRDQLSIISEVPEDAIADSQFKPTSQWYSDTGFPGLDVQAGTDLINQVESETGSQVSFSLATTPIPENTAVTQTLKQQWEACGMTVELEAIEQSTFISDTVLGNYQANLWRQFGAADPDGDYVWWIGKNAEGPLALNMARLSDPQIDEALNTARASDDPEVRKEAYATLQQRQTELLPYVWLSHTLWVVAGSNDVRNLVNQTLPDGQPSAPMQVGSHRLTETWLQQGQ